MIVVLAGLTVYLNSFDGAFVFDEPRYIQNNQAIRQLWPPWHLLTGRRPVVELSLAANYAVSGLDVGSYHGLNLTVHLLAALTLFGVVRRTLTGRYLRRRHARAAPWVALAVALIWVVHPLNTQSVTYIIQRGESMMGMFYLLTLYCLIRGAASPRASRGWWYAAAVAACALGMGSKAVMVTAPLVVLLYDRVFIASPGSGFAELLSRRWPLYVGLGATWSVLFACGLVRGVLYPEPSCTPTVGFGFKGITPLEYAMTQPGVLLHYLRLAVWPHPLCLDYGWPVARTAGATLVPILVVVGLLAGTVWALLRRSWVGFSGACFFIILAPTTSMIPIKDPAVEHRMYLPLAVVLVLAVIAGRAVCAYASGRFSWLSRRQVWLTTGLVVLVAAPLGLATVRRNRDYRSKLVMWGNVVARQPRHARAHNNLGLALQDAGRLEEATAHYRKAIQLEPCLVEAHYNLGNVLRESGSIDEAVGCFEEALHLKPTYNKARVNLAGALKDGGWIDLAIEQYSQALAHDPNLPKVHYNLANSLVAHERFDEAIEHYRTAIRLRPDYVAAHNNLAWTLKEQGDLTGAIESYRAALRYKGDSDDVYADHYNLGNALVLQGNIDEAVEHYRQALRLRANFAPACKSLGDALARRGDLDTAVREYRRLLRLQPGDAETHYRLGLILDRQDKLEEAVRHYREAVRLDPAHASAQQMLSRALSRLEP